MDAIETKALALWNEVQVERGIPPSRGCNRGNYSAFEALCRAIERHEAFKQEVSDAVRAYKADNPYTYNTFLLDRFIITKPDPLVEVCREIGLAPYRPEEIRAAIEKRGGKITWGKS